MEEIQGVLVKPSAEDLKKAEHIFMSCPHEIAICCAYCIAKALADQREEDAKIAESEKVEALDQHPEDLAYNQGIDDAVAAIRKGKGAL